MNSNHFLISSVFLMFFSMGIFFISLVLFVIKYKIKNKNIMLVSHFLNYCFYGRNVRSFISIFSLMLSLLFGGVVEFLKTTEIKYIYVYLTGMSSMFFYFLYCNLYSYNKFNLDAPNVFIREFLFNLSINYRTTLLWLSRLLYIISAAFVIFL